MSPELLKALMEMGHGDELVIGDGNFPANAYPEKVIRLDGHGIPDILDAVLSLFPLDTYVSHPSVLMKVVDGDKYNPEIWDVFREIALKHDNDGLRETLIDRMNFYERARHAYAVVATGEKALYANIILKKGVV